MRGFLGQTIVICAVVSIVVSIAVVTALKESIESYWNATDLAAIASDQEASVFDAKIADYAAERWDSGATKSQSTKPEIKKIIIINVADKKKDDLNSSLPEDMRASNQQEVDAVVLIRRGEESVGRYTDGALAIRRTASISVFLTNGETLCPNKALQGSEPPKSKSGRGSKAYGTEPKEEVMSYIRLCIGAK